MNSTSEVGRYDKEEIKDIYEEFYESEDFIRFPVADWRFVKALAIKYRIKKGVSVLDIACGTGKFSNYLNRCEADVTGIDISQNAIEIASQKYPDIDFVVGDAMNLPFPKKNFEIVFCHGFSLFNEPDLESTRYYMEMIAEYLAEEGLFVFGKTSSLTDEMAENKSRMDHSVDTFVDFFSSLNDFEVIGTHATIPHVFIPLGRLGFSNIVTSISTSLATRLNFPLRVYIVLRRLETNE